MVVQSLSNVLKSLMLFILMYIFINNPALKFTGGFGTIRLLIPIAFVAYYFNSSLRQSILNFKIEMFIFFLIIVFSFIRGLLDFDFSFTRSFMFSLIDSVFLSNFFFVIFFKNKNYNWLPFFYAVGVVSALISVYCLLDIQFNIALKNLQVADDSFYDNMFRNFGLAGNLTSSYGITQAIILILMLYNFKKNYHFSIYVVLIAVSILINARTGFVIVAVVLLYLIIARRKYVFLICLVASCAALITLLSTIEFSPEFEKTFKWVTDFFGEISNLFSSTNTLESSTADVLLNDMLILPDSIIEWIVGSGKSNFGLVENGTDVGFFLQLKYGGISN